MNLDLYKILTAQIQQIDEERDEQQRVARQHALDMVKTGLLSIVNKILEEGSIVIPLPDPTEIEDGFQIEIDGVIFSRTLNSAYKGVNGELSPLICSKGCGASLGTLQELHSLIRKHQSFKDH